MTRVTLASAADAGTTLYHCLGQRLGGVLFPPALISAALSHYNVVELAKTTLPQQPKFSHFLLSTLSKAAS
jgi:hypothetical protein